LYFNTDSIRPQTEREVRVRQFPDSMIPVLERREREMLQEEYEKELEFYVRYHRHPINWIVHTICIPIEWYCFLLFLSYLPSLSFSLSSFSLSFHWMISIMISVYYMLIPQSKMKFFASFLHIFLAYAVDHTVRYFQWNTRLILTCCLYFVSWFIQVFIGHYYFEKNSPAMTKKLTLNSIILSVLLSWDY
jgi:uncharacterized membrane protein YGL010W